jgi:putative membrane protein
MMRWAILLGLVGLAVATGLIVWSGYEQVLQALSVAGWGIVWTSLFHVVTMVLSILGWQVLLGKGRPSKAYFLYLLWIRAAINNLMPVARIGGEIVAVRMMIRHGVRKSQAIACTVVETTMSVVAVFLFTVVGVALFALRVSDRNMIGQLLFGLLLSVPLIGALLAAQKIGVFTLLTKLFRLMFKDTWQKFTGNTKHLDRTIRVMYKRRRRVLACLFWQVVAWSSGSGEIWLALYFLGHTRSVAEAVMIEALIQATSSAAFIVPGALGVQEAGYLLFGHLLGLTPDIAAALAVIRRCRDLLLYVPGLVWWQILEGRLLLDKRNLDR